MKFKSILSFFKKSERTVESLPTMDFFFTGSLLNDNFHNIESMLNEGFQINEEHSEILKEKLQDLASYFYPRSFYKVGLHLNGKIIPNKISQYIQKSTWGSQYDIKREIEHNINSLSIPLQLKQMRYFQIISKHNLLDDFILENIQTQSNIGQFFNVISGINKYYINNFNSETLENYNNNLNLEYSNIYKENPLFKSDSLEKYIKRNTNRNIRNSLSADFVKHILNNNELQISLTSTKKYNCLGKEKYTVMDKVILEQFPIYDLKKMSFLPIITPFVYASNISSEDKTNAHGYHSNSTIVSFKKTYEIDPQFHFTQLDGETRNFSAKDVFSHLNNLSQNLFKRISEKISLEQGENALYNMLENKHIYSFCLLTNSINNFSSEAIPYNIKKGNKILEVINYVKKRNPHPLILESTLSAIEKQVILANSLIIKFNLQNDNINNNDLEQHLNTLKKNNFQKSKTIEETIEESTLSADIKTTLLEILKTRSNILSTNSLSTDEDNFLNTIFKKVQQVIDLNELVDNKIEVLEHCQSLYEDIFTLEYSLVKKKRDIANEELLILENLKNSKSKIASI